MCNLYTQTTAADAMVQLARQLGMALDFPEGVPNLMPRDIAITDPGPILRSTQAGGLELVVRRWSWPGPNGKPVYNFRSEGREFTSGRCVILSDGFYEFTKPADPKQKRKDRWLFTMADSGLVGIAGLIRQVAGIGEAFTMLTTEPGSDVAPYHGRQVAVLPTKAWRDWLTYQATPSELLRPLPAGSLVVRGANLSN